MKPLEPVIVYIGRSILCRHIPTLSVRPEASWVLKTSFGFMFYPTKKVGVDV